MLTTGDGSGALFAQSIGGGGGNGGGGIAYGTAGSVTVNVAMGGKGGSGGAGGDVNVNNYASGAIMTVGAGAPGIFAQSIGGTGGNGGRGAVSGGVSPETLILDYLKTGQLAATYTQSYGDSDTFVQGWKNTARRCGDNEAQKLAAMATDYVKTNIGGLPPAQGDGGGSFTLNVTVGVVQTGSGGSGGKGGSVTVLNEGQILTQGPASSGIQAQSVGGGGGRAGSVLVGTSGSFLPENITANFVIGGSGGAAGDGGVVSITNYNQVTTQGDQSHGLVAQSVGGGGGLAGYTGSPAAGRSTYGFTLGGDGGASGNGGGGDGVPGVSVENFAATVGTAVVNTAGDDAVGIIAQNIGGGGGLMSFMYAVADGNGGVVSTSSQANLSTPVVLTLSAKTAPAAAGCDSPYLVAACGNAGEAYVTSDTIGTSGRNSHGVVAQSIGGGGGALFGGTLTGNNFFANSATSMGNGGQVLVNIRGPLTTSGDGAIGVIAQSIGGGGLLGGDVASAGGSVPRPSNFQGAATPSFFQGDGGEVDVNVVQGGSIRTTGAFAHGIYAQSVGGGGGLIVTQDGGWIDGSGGGIGSAGKIAIEVDGIVTTAGKGAIGVYANSDGSTASPSPVSINVTGAVASQQSDAIMINSSATIEHGDQQRHDLGRRRPDRGDRGQRRQHRGEREQQRRRQPLRQRGAGRRHADQRRQLVPRWRERRQRVEHRHHRRGARAHGRRAVRHADRAADRRPAAQRGAADHGGLRQHAGQHAAGRRHRRPDGQPVLADPDVHRHAAGDHCRDQRRAGAGREHGLRRRPARPVQLPAQQHRGRERPHRAAGHAAVADGGKWPARRA